MAMKPPPRKKPMTKPKPVSKPVAKDKPAAAAVIEKPVMMAVSPLAAKPKETAKERSAGTPPGGLAADVDGQAPGDSEEIEEVWANP